MDKVSLPRLLTVSEVAEALRLSRKTLYRHLERGLIRGQKVGGEWRIPASELDRILREGLRAEPRDMGRHA